MTRSRESKNPSARPVEVSGAGDELLTSDDLFGEIVDELGGERLRETAPRRGPQRKGPVKVQISEPNVPEAAGGRAPLKTAPEPLPEDVAALLDAFAPPEDEPRRPPKKARSEAEEVDQLMERLEPLAGEEAGPRAAAAPFDVDALFKPAEQGSPLELPSPEPPGLEDEPEIHSGHTAPKFQAAPPRPAAEAAPLDLAAVAEDALGEAPRPASPARPPVPAREGNWRDDVYGPYRLLDRVAVGGMAEVFKAKRSGVEGFEKVVAVKRILPHLSDNQEFVDMFVDEAKMVAGLTHPNIVQIFDLGKIEKSYYIAMEYVHGRDLRTILRRAKEKGLRMPLDLSLRIVSQVSAALEYAHRKRDDRGRPMEIVHRDVSPQNILISFEGDVKLTDFGIAKAATKASTTDRGALRGKLLYMSPEQAWGKPMDRRSDLFSLGIVLYEMVTDGKPFLTNGSEMSILEMVRQCQIAPPRSLNPRLPEALERLLMKALERDPADRFQNAGEMGRSLERVMRERHPLSANELARFMELLFDRAEREEAVPEDQLLRTGTPRPAGGSLPGPPAPSEGPEGEPASIVQDPMSVDTLLKRFGIK